MLCLYISISYHVLNFLSTLSLSLPLPFTSTSNKCIFVGSQIKMTHFWYSDLDNNDDDVDMTTPITLHGCEAELKGENEELRRKLRICIIFCSVLLFALCILLMKGW